MAKAELQWDGLAELGEWLHGLPEELQGEAASLVTYHARNAEGQLLVRYPSVSGHLRRGVRLQQSLLKSGSVRAVLVSKAPHAHLYESGTKVRMGRGGRARGKGSRSHGKLANRGAMPAFHTFRDVVGPNRERLLEDLIGLLERRGFVVTNAAA
jgi:hypothetical protein